MVVQQEIRTSFATWRSKIQNDNPQINRSVLLLETREVCHVVPHQCSNQ
jgi:hypothetical protein